MEGKFFHANLRKSDPGSSKPSKGAKSFHQDTPLPLPLTKLQARVSHLQDAEAKEGGGGEDGTGLQLDSGQRWEGVRGARMERGGGLIAWQLSRGTCIGDIIPSHP